MHRAGSPSFHQASAAAVQAILEREGHEVGYEQAVREERWLVVPLWHPQYLHHRSRILALHEPLGLLGGADDATMLIRRDAEPWLSTQPWRSD